MEFKGTKGEWEIDTNGEPFLYCDEYHGSFKIKSNKSVACEVYAYSFFNLTFEEAKANAQLIATAPKLLEALQQAIEMCDKIQFPTEQELKDFVKLGKQVIKQATKID
jgi:hypothetical protein